MKKLILPLLFIAFSLSARANWISTYIPLGKFSSVIIKGDTILAGCYSNDISFNSNAGGVYISTNNGVTWRLLNNDYANQYISGLYVNGSNVYMISHGYLNLLSGNGSKWTFLTGGYMSWVYCVAANGYSLFAGRDDGLFYSTDGGTNWTARQSGIPANTKVKCISVNNGKIYAGTDRSGVFMSGNNGVTWTAANNGFTDLSVSCLSVNGGNIYAGTDSGRIFMSVNNGLNWSVTTATATDTTINSIVINGSNMFAGSDKGLFLSSNNGSSWSTMDSGFISADTKSLCIYGSKMFAATGTGFYSSVNNAVSWDLVSNGLKNTWVSSLGVNGDTVFAGCWNSAPPVLFKTTNGGGNWIEKDSGYSGSYGEGVRAFAFLGSHLFASSGGGLMRSDDGGDHWRAVPYGAIYRQVVALDVIGSTIFASQYDLSGVPLAKSADSGATWQACTYPSPEYTRALAHIGTVLFAGNPGVFTSSDYGDSWTNSSSGLTNTHVYSLAVSGYTIYAGTEDGVFYSINNGGYWLHLTAGMPANTIVEALAISGTTVFAGTYGSGVYVSKNGGNWFPYNTGLLYPYVSALAIAGNTVYAGTSEGGIFMSDLDAVTAVNEIKGPPESFDIYPNPAAGETTLSLPKGFKRITVSNVQGQLIFEKQTRDLQTVIKIRGRGIYFVNVQSDSFSATKRLVLE